MYKMCSFISFLCRYGGNHLVHHFQMIEVIDIVGMFRLYRKRHNVIVMWICGSYLWLFFLVSNCVDKYVSLRATPAVSKNFLYSIYVFTLSTTLYLFLLQQYSLLHSLLYLNIFFYYFTTFKYYIFYCIIVSHQK